VQSYIGIGIGRGGSRLPGFLHGRALLFLALLTAGTGCGAGQGTARFAQVQQKTVYGPLASKSTAPTPSGAASSAEPGDASVQHSDCELRLYIEQAPGQGAFGVEAGALGVAVVERDGKDWIDGVCIKRVDRQLQLPASMQIAGDEGLGRFCRDEPTPNQTIASGGTRETTSVCQWNGVFHTARPFTFTIVARPDTRIDRYVQFIRVYRNGELMAAWNAGSDTPDASRVVIEGSPLRTGFWAPTQPPHESPIDLRLIPADADLSDVVDLAVRDDKKRFEQRISRALKAGANEMLPIGSPARASLDCLKERLAHAQNQILKVVRGEVQLPNLETGCTMQLDLGDQPALSEAFSKLSDTTHERLARLEREAQATLDKAGDQLERELPPVRAKALADGAQQLLGAHPAIRSAVELELSKRNLDVVQFLERAEDAGFEGTNLAALRALYADFKALVHDVDAQVRLALRTVDEARMLSVTLFQEARSVGTDSNRQAQIFDAVVRSLEEEPSTFEARRDNPPLLTGEQKVAMEYSDRWQGFMFAPWNGVPIQVTDEAVADLNASVAVPLLDVGGVRLQWGSTRFSEARLSLGFGYTSTEVEGENGEQTNTAAFLPFISLGLGTFRVGFGIAATSAISEFKERYRAIVGVDLFKLISGSNVEVL